MDRPPAAIFFDLDGTILDWQTGMEDSWRAACETHCDGPFLAAKSQRDSVERHGLAAYFGLHRYRRRVRRG